MRKTALTLDVVIYRNDAADFQIDEHNLDMAQQSSQALIVTGTALAQSPSRETTMAAMTRAAMTVIDLDYRAYSWCDHADTQATYLAACEQAEIIVGNDEEFDMLAPGRGLDWARQAATRGKTIIYKMGSRGSIAMTPVTEFETGIFDVNALKPFGAGDAFMGGMIACLAKAMPRTSQSNSVLPAPPLSSAHWAVPVRCPQPNKRKNSSPLIRKPNNMHIAPFNNNNQPIVDINDPITPLVFFNIVKLKAGETFTHHLADYGAVAQRQAASMS